MEFTPRGLARWLPILSIILGVEAALSVVLPFTWDSLFRTLTHLPHVAMLMGFAAAIRMMTAPDASTQSFQRLLWGGGFVIGATALARFEDLSFFGSTSRLWLVPQGLGALLLGIAGPGIWGAALAREENLQDPRISAVGRIFAGASLAGFLAYLVGDASLVFERGWSLKGGSPALLPYSLFQTAARCCLLGSTIAFWRTLNDEGARRTQSRRIQALMASWLLATGIGWVFLSFIRTMAVSVSVWGDPLMLLWHGGVQFTLTVIFAILVAVALEAPSPPRFPKPREPYVPEPPPPPPDTSPIDVP